MNCTTINSVALDIWIWHYEKSFNPRRNRKMVCSGNVVVTTFDYESGRPGSSPDWMMVAALSCVWPSFKVYHRTYAPEITSIKLHDSLELALPRDSIITSPYKTDKDRISMYPECLSYLVFSCPRWSSSAWRTSFFPSQTDEMFVRIFFTPLALLQQRSEFVTLQMKENKWMG